MTAGISFKAGHSRLDGSTLAKVRDINKQREEKQLATAMKKQEAEDELKCKVDHAQAKGPAPENWTVNDVKAMVSWYKRPGDSKMPSKRDKLIERYALTKNRSEAERSRLKEGEEAVVDDDEERNGGGENNGEGENNGDATGK